MKNLKLIITVFAITLSSVLTIAAKDKSPVDSKKNLRAEIISLLGDQVPVELNNSKSLDVEISFLLNKDSELVILSVGSSDAKLESFVKSKLNYKSVKTNGVKKGEVFRIPLKVVES